MSVVVPTFLVTMLAGAIIWHQYILFFQAQRLFNPESACPPFVWQYEEDPKSFCVPPRTDHSYFVGRARRAAGAICWYVEKSSLPADTIFYPDLNEPRKGYRCNFP